MNGKTVVILGAGATKACGGPMTNEILYQVYDLALRAKMAVEGYNAIIEREKYANLLEEFLIRNFNLPPDPTARKKEDYPALPLLLSLIDTALDRKEPLAPKWVPERVPENEQLDINGRRSLVDVRQAIEYLIFALLDYQLRTIADHHQAFFAKLYPRLGFEPTSDDEPTVISLNYDIIADNTLIEHSTQWWPVEGRFPDYGADIATDAYRRQAGYYGKLFKLHGSLNWLYCPGCHRLDIGLGESGNRMIKVLETLYIENPLKPQYSCEGSPCADPECGVNVRPILITPTYRKDYRNPHISRVWHQAERALREADHAIFVGYSLPDDDVEVVYLLKRGINRERCKITVIEYDQDYAPGARQGEAQPGGANGKKHKAPVDYVYERYRSLFGNIDWHPEGFAAYIDGIQDSGPERT